MEVAKPTDDEYIDAARRGYEDGLTRIAAHPYVTRATRDAPHGKGAWVEAVVWVGESEVT